MPCQLRQWFNPSHLSYIYDILVNKINADQARQWRYYFKRYLVIQDSSCRNHTKIEYKDGLLADGDTCRYHNKSYHLTWCMTSTWRDLHEIRCLARLITANKNATDLPNGGSSSLARRRELERTGIKICQDHSHLVKSWVIKPLVDNPSLLYINKSLRDRKTLAILLEWAPKFRWVSKQSLERAHCVVSVRLGRERSLWRVTTTTRSLTSSLPSVGQS